MLFYVKNFLAEKWQISLELMEEGKKKNQILHFCPIPAANVFQSVTVVLYLNTATLLVVFMPLKQVWSEKGLICVNEG